jgi:hypothetical protein
MLVGQRRRVRRIKAVSIVVATMFVSSPLSLSFFFWLSFPFPSLTPHNSAINRSSSEIVPRWQVADRRAQTLLRLGRADTRDGSVTLEISVGSEVVTGKSGTGIAIAIAEVESGVAMTMCATVTMCETAMGGEANGGGGLRVEVPTAGETVTEGTTSGGGLIRWGNFSSSTRAKGDNGKLYNLHETLYLKEARASSRSITLLFSAIKNTVRRGN